MNPFHETPSGILPASPEVRLQAAGVGATYRELDLERVEDKDHLMLALRTDLDLPEYFGNNWDALADVLSDPEQMPDAYGLGLCGLGQFQRRHPRLWHALEDALLDAQKAIAGAGKRLWILEVSADADLPGLD